MMQMPAFWNGLWPHLEHLSIAYILTASIGWEREQEAHSAGVRTSRSSEWPVADTSCC